MKLRNLSAALLVVCLSLSSFAQDIELIPYGSWQWGGKVKMVYGEAKFKGGENFGGALNIVMPNEMAIQLEYFRQFTSVTYREYYPSTDFETFDVTVDWYQVGGLRQLPVHDIIEPFGGFTLGAANVRGQSDRSKSEWAFAVTGQIGTKIYLSDRIGLRLHLRMLVPIQYAGFGFYFGSGGSGTSVNAGSYFIQGDVGGGLVIRL